MSEKMSHASRKFMTTPASRITIRVRSRWLENARGSSDDALLPFQAHEAADGQPVEGVDRVLAAMQDPRARREADAELVDPHAGRPGHREVAELVEHHERDQDDQQQHDVDEAVEDHRARHPPVAVGACAPRHGPARSRSTRSSTSGSGAVAEPLHGTRGDARHAREA